MSPDTALALSPVAGTLPSQLEEKLAKLKLHPADVTATDACEAFAFVMRAYRASPQDGVVEAVNEQCGFKLILYGSVSATGDPSMQQPSFDGSPYTLLKPLEKINFGELSFYDVSLSMDLQGLAMRRGPRTLAERTERLGERLTGRMWSPSLTRKLLDEIVLAHGHFVDGGVEVVEFSGKAGYSSYPPQQGYYRPPYFAPLLVAGQKMFAELQRSHLPPTSEISSGPFMRAARDMSGSLVAFRPLEATNAYFAKE